MSVAASSTLALLNDFDLLSVRRAVVADESHLPQFSAAGLTAVLVAGAATQSILDGLAGAAAVLHVVLREGLPPTRRTCGHNCVKLEYTPLYGAHVRACVSYISFHSGYRYDKALLVEFIKMLVILIYTKYKCITTQLRK